MTSRRKTKTVLIPCPRCKSPTPIRVTTLPARGRQYCENRECQIGFFVETGVRVRAIDHPGISKWTSVHTGGWTLRT